MAWNEPGGNNNRPNDPWGNGNKNQGPPDLDELLSKFFDKLSKMFGGSGNGGGADSIPVSLILVVLAIAYGLWGFETVDEGKKGIVQQFGEYTRTVDPGPAFIFKPFQRIRVVDVQNVFKVDNENYRQGEREMLTVDENIVIVKYVVQYRIGDPQAYLFQVENPVETLRQTSESAIREIVGRNTLDYITTDGRDVVSQQAKALTQEMISAYGAGITIQSVSLTEAQFPEEVQAAIDDQTKAREDKERFINEAEAYRNQVVPEARGEAAKLVEQARGYKVKTIKSAEGEASRFTQLVSEYRKAPQVTRDRLYLDAVEYVLANSSKVMVDTDGGNNVMYLPLDKIVNQTSGTTNNTFVLPSRDESGVSATESYIPRSRARTRELR